MMKYVHTKDNFNPATTCGLCGQPLPEDDSQDKLDPLAVAIFMLAHTGQPLPSSRSMKRTAKRLVRDGLIYSTPNNARCPYGNYSQASELVLEILAMDLPHEME